MKATRAEGLCRLRDFTPRMGGAYAVGRNFDTGVHADVSRLSPYVRHRLVTEREVVAAALGAGGSQKFIDEVFWRSYWKGWLQLRPGVWDASRAEVSGAPPPGLDAAIEGRTGITCFDAWARELSETGWLHNHARMWFASIWIFTLRLPWELGADHFLRHLLDGDAASNTLSWRWVAGIQTRGKPYVALAENIARFTQGRFNPVGQLDENPAAIVAPEPPPPSAFAPGDAVPAGRIALLLHEDDLHPESLGLEAAQVVGIAGLTLPGRGAPVEPAVAAFTKAAMSDALARASLHFGATAESLAPEAVADWAARLSVADVVMPYAPVGWVADAMVPIEAALAERGIRLHRVLRAWDAACWPLATKGFFAFREHIPALIERLTHDIP
ncbi:MAG: FAD-binding domain-containing protein [Pseudomonadota bacterium]